MSKKPSQTDRRLSESKNLNHTPRDTAPSLDFSKEREESETLSQDSNEGPNQTFSSYLKHIFLRPEPKKKNKKEYHGYLEPIYVEVKIEPKTILANERTLLQWFGLTSLLVVGSSVYLSVANLVSSLLAYAIVFSGFTFLFYSIVIFLFRRHKMFSREVTSTYGDPCGSVVLVFLVLFYFTFSIWITFSATVYILPSTPVMRVHSVPLNPFALMLASEGNQTAFMADLDNILSAEGIRGTFTFPTYTELEYFDSHDCTFAKGGYLFRSVQMENKESLYYEMDWGTDDISLATNFDIDSNSKAHSADQLLNATLRVIPKNKPSFHRRLTAPGSTPFTPDGLHSFFAQRFPDIPIQRPAVVSLTEKIIEEKWGDVQVSFGDKFKQADINIYLYYKVGNRTHPFYGEITFVYETLSLTPLQIQEGIKLREFWSMLRDLSYVNSTPGCPDLIQTIYQPFCDITNI